MATRDIGDQKRAQKRSEDAEEVEAQESSDRAADAAERKEQLDADIDDVLADIDSALEVNSEDFVRGFVQKGGQ